MNIYFDYWGTDGSAHLSDEAGLPGRQLDLVDAPQQLPHDLQAGILVPHHAHTGPLYLHCQPPVHWDQQGNHGQPCQESVPHLCQSTENVYLADTGRSSARWVLDRALSHLNAGDMNRPSLGMGMQGRAG